jgi:hypothetical protein
MYRVGKGCAIDRKRCRATSSINEMSDHLDHDNRPTQRIISILSLPERFRVINDVAGPGPLTLKIRPDDSTPIYHHLRDLLQAPINAR